MPKILQSRMEYMFWVYNTPLCRQEVANDNYDKETLRREILDAVKSPLLDWKSTSTGQQKRGRNKMTQNDELKPDAIPKEYWITIAEINAVWGNANFGEKREQNRRLIILETLLQIGGDYAVGYTAMSICKALKLVTPKSNSRKNTLTAKGKRVMYYWNKYLNTRAETHKEPVDVEGLKKQLLSWQDSNYWVGHDLAVIYVVDYLAEQGYLQQPNQWQKIETAPKTGETILLADHVTVVSGYYCTETDKFYLENTNHTDFVDGVVDWATHWKHLDEPPKENE